MRSFWIVVPFYVLKYRKLQLLQGTVTFAVCFFFLQIFEKAFTAGIVKRIAFLWKRLHNIQRIQKLPECEGGILGSPVGVKHKAVRGLPFFVSSSKCSDNQFCISMGRNMPGNDFPGKEIHHNTQIVPFPSGFEKGNVTGPYKIGSFLFKILLQMVRTGLIVRTSGRSRRFIGGHFRKL